MATIDIDALRAYLLDYCGTAMFGGFPRRCSTWRTSSAWTAMSYAARRKILESTCAGS